MLQDRWKPDSQDSWALLKMSEELDSVVRVFEFIRQRKATEEEIEDMRRILGEGGAAALLVRCTFVFSGHGKARPASRSSILGSPARSFFLRIALFSRY
jgi:hypothetical protein